MLSFFKRNKAPREENYPDFSFLGTDFHSHLLPGIDDGSPDPETSVQLIQGLQEQGFHRLITTPHIIQDIYPNTAETIQKAYQLLQEYAAQRGVELPLRFAAEYMLDDSFKDQVTRKNLLTLDGEKVLVEFPMAAAPLQEHQLLFDMQMHGYVPVLAHPERYRYWHTHLSHYEQLKNNGAYLQLNLTSLVGYHGSDVKKVAWQLLRKGWVDFLATDLHHEKHLRALQSFRQSLAFAELQKYPFLNGQLTEHS